MSVATVKAWAGGAYQNPAVIYLGFLQQRRVELYDEVIARHLSQKSF